MLGLHLGGIDGIVKSVGRRDDVDPLRDRGTSLGQGSGLVQYHRVDTAHLLERRRVLDQDLILGPAPIPTISAVGVASPSAQGQAITSTETADNSACEK